MAPGQPRSSSRVVDTVRVLQPYGLYYTVIQYTIHGPCMYYDVVLVDAVTGAKPKVVLRSLYTVYSRGDCMVGRWYGILYA